METGGSRKKNVPARRSSKKAQVASKKQTSRDQERMIATLYPSRRPLGRQRWRFRVVAFNGKKLAQSSEAYTNKPEAVVALKLVIGDHPFVEADT